MIVMKFGGTSVKDAEAVDRVASIIAGRLEEKPVVVVSALGKTTDKLVSILSALKEGRVDDAREVAASIKEHHYQVVEQVVTDTKIREVVVAAIQEHLSRLTHLIDGMACLGEVSARSTDATLSLGECMAAPLLAAALVSRGLPAAAVNPRDIIVTDATYENAIPILDATSNRCQSVLGALLQNGKLPVVGGYVGATEDGIITTLGRGGSDLTASVIAKSLGAIRLEYWKDVDGILTADPSLVPSAHPVPRLTFREAAELAFLGARVLHPASIQPAIEAGIPVRVLNSYRKNSPGTLIARHDLVADKSLDNRYVISSVACKRDQILVNVYSTRMLGATGFLRRVFEVFDRLSLSVDHIATSEVNITVSLAKTPKLDSLKIELGEVASVKIEAGVGIVSVVSENLPSTPGIASRIFSALTDTNIKLVTYGGSGVNLSFVIEDSEVPRAVQSLHGEFFG